ncbi:SMP-30/gluconolactonase/LRE family protein [Lentzea sp. NBRC 105346]|uniref:SMP-30/gluconolactonase/LRE family protein n=1 Tax=Lentzea sp. NBRC 105346 TaxID=3032205 RepID=UPI002554D2A2|nr:SMP-30/gluconolactonase/LRE family protein [Lentzea sp. NBRC 105346]
MRLAALIATITTAVALVPVPASAAPVTIAVGPRPESITKGWDGKFFVSVQGVPDLGKLDGEIRIVNPATGEVKPFATGLDNPRGLAFTQNHLVVTDTDKIWLIDSKGTRKLLASAAQFPHPAEFFNDAAPAPDGVYVTEMGARTKMRDPNGFLWPTDSQQGLDIPALARVYRVSLSGKITEVVSPSRKTLVINGTAPARKPGTLLVGEFFYGNVVSVNLMTGAKTVIATGFRGADGIEQGRDGTIYVSSFDNGIVWKMDRDGEKPVVLLKDVGRSSTADFYLDEAGNRLLVPDTAHGTVIVVPTK